MVTVCSLDSVHSLLDQIQKGYNKAASVFIDDCLSAIQGLDVDSPLFRSKIQLQQCTIMSGMGKYEEALSSCDSAVDIRCVIHFRSPHPLCIIYNFLTDKGHSVESIATPFPLHPRRRRT